MGSPPAESLGDQLTTPHHKNTACYEMSHGFLELDGFFGTTW